MATAQTTKPSTPAATKQEPQKKTVQDIPSLELKMRCLELARSIPSGQEQALETRAQHLWNWIKDEVAK